VDDAGMDGTGIIAMVSEEVGVAGGAEVAGVSTGPEVGAETGVERTGGVQETTVAGSGSGAIQYVSLAARNEDLPARATSILPVR
jgi:hypothetical protein